MGSEPVIVVSGAPRSGTSMAMRMLGAGGVELVTDNARPADAANPHGYFEYEPAHALATDAAWLWRAGGRAVKIVHPHISYLPPNLPCRIVFMVRDVTAISRSQLGLAGLADDDHAGVALRLMLDLALALDRLRAHHGPALIELTYEDVLAAPEEAARRLADFVGRPLDLSAMVSAVDHRSAGPPPC